MTQIEVLVALNMACDIGSTRLKKLLEYFGKPQEILEAPQEKLNAVAGIGENIASRIRALKSEDISKEFKSAQRLGLKILTPEDAEYPHNLKYIYDPPIVLYVKGELEPEDSLALGIVGSRRASFYGLSCAQRFAEELSAHNFTIVSGMARGVDTAAHRGALKAGGRTIAVIGSGFNNIYPQENVGLAEEIAASGAVISEFSINTQPLPQNFPRRNRIISGLSLGILVVEAAQNSGAMITADCALEQGREVFALPGKVDSATSFGPNTLIKQGAKLVCAVEDILEEFNLLPQEAKKEKVENTDKANAVISQESQVYELISSESIHLDELLEKTKLDIPRVSGILLSLQLKKLIRQLPGKQFVRNRG
ncbi:MAG: DNA-processing protein DprA [Candidatus Omnitrophica bacterium]|nr:DNA-processing protein DprA [Candidatus Omnitrophota bacterium]